MMLQPLEDDGLDILSRDCWDSGEEGPPLVVAYFTVDTPYQDEAEVLKLSLQSVGYSYEICGVPNLHSWQKNTQFKSTFVLQMLLEHPGKPLLYLDVDCIMVQDPVALLDVDGDVAAVHFARGNELLSGTVYFANTPACREVVSRWVEINALYPERLPDGRLAWDQRTLEMAIKGVPCRFVELPQNYTWIVELTQRYAPGLSPVIMHTRGAKRFKNRINKVHKTKGYAK